ncbi:MAG: MAPEG family protein [SAR86 cluster bacterium]|uniref:MAPEG family protein n=1 Tax=SAR86 cluster bacterium TaxID=2030880 RepID=A0A972VZF3_9GAMM|nr:MAPEG family protein [Pseudomonadales bacterium]NQV66356.1 MAPEG family protein [SAR86 cluster bacterium]
MNTTILAPAAVLVAWSMVMMLWVVVTRFRAFGEAGVDLANAEPGGRYVDLEATMPAKVNWKAHNFTHLMEQPTIFYAVVCIIAIAGGSGAVVAWAWAYTFIRIAHSLWQSLVNTVPIRFALFVGSNVCLLVLSYHALSLTLG